MPIEPPLSHWVFPDPGEAEQDVVAVGADLEPATLLEAYRSGLFPMPMSEVDAMSWWAPQRRGVLALDALRVTRSMRQSAKHFEVSVDGAFDEVVRRCADPSRPGAWIDARIASAYSTLHSLGWAHSVEVWRDGLLAGGLYGVAIGGLFAGESMFHVQRDASKVALMSLVDVLDDGDPRRLVDVQWSTPHLESLGVVEVGRVDYLTRLRAALAVPLPALWRKQPVERRRRMDAANRTTSITHGGVNT
jgi:leucyl/phenylalanyl-tRNA--protein transferase